MRRTLPLALIALLALAGTALADGFLVPTSRTEPIRGPYAVKDHRVTIEIDGQRARTEVRQTFVNLTRGPLEVTYLFPVPEGAMIDGLTLVVDGREFKGRLLPAAEAIRLYEEIVRTKRDPALLTYAGRGLIRTQVFPLPAGGKREVIVRYHELLPRDGNLVKLAYPLDTERFSARPIEIVDVKVEIRSPTPIKAVYSPTHPMKIERPTDTRAVARWARERVIPDRDLRLYYSVGQGDLGASLLSYFPESEEYGHFLLLLSPRGHLDEEEAIGKNLVLVLDHSGSMQGQKIEQAKAALRYVLGSLTRKDRVNVVAFSSTARALYAKPRPWSQKVRDEALAFVTAIPAAGGTDIMSALGLALDGLERDPERQNTILFLTDGLPTVGVRDTREIVSTVAARNRAARDARLFVFGVGYDVNAQFLDRLVEENGGVSENVRPSESVEISVTSLYAKIRHAALTDLLVKIDGVEVFDVYPRTASSSIGKALEMPDLFAGSQLVVAGRYKRGGPAAVVLGGKVRDQKRVYKFPMRFEKGSDPDEKPFVARVWATMKIGFLLDQMRVMGRRDKELVEEVVRLSTKYGIVTEYTAFLADERNDFRDLAANEGRARDELGKKLAAATGGSGVNQAVNTKRLRGQQQAEEKQHWLDESGKDVEVATVRNI
ncbi:MAG: VIT and vWA domain-containing protein, partial [Planctomycetota bacterium]